MRRRWLLLGVMIVILAASAVYAANSGFDRTVIGKWVVLTTGDAPIEVYEADGVTPVTEIDFGTTFVDYFGSGRTPTHKVVVKNLSDTVVRIIVTGDTGDDILPVFGPTTGDLKKAPENAFILQPKSGTADFINGWVALELLKPTSGSKQTTIVFNATESSTLGTSSQSR